MNALRFVVRLLLQAFDFIILKQINTLFASGFKAERKNTHQCLGGLRMEDN